MTAETLSCPLIVVGAMGIVAITAISWFHDKYKKLLVCLQAGVIRDLAKQVPAHQWGQRRCGCTGMWMLEAEYHPLVISIWQENNEIHCVVATSDHSGMIHTSGDPWLKELFDNIVLAQKSGR